MNDSATKTCPLCCEPVQPAARKCPHCQHFLNKWVLAAYHPLVAISPMLLMFGIGFYCLSRAFNRGQDFEPFRPQVVVTDSKIELGEVKTGPTVAVVGTLRNESNLAWKDVTLEVRFFDKAHRLIDTRQRSEYSLILPAKGTSAFKITQPREFPPEDYVTHEVQIVAGRDTHGFPY